MQNTVDLSSWRVTEPWIMNTDKHLSSSNAPEIEEDVRLCLANSPDTLTLNCAQLVYMTGAGVRALLNMARMAKQKDSIFTLKNLSGQPREIFYACGADAFITLNDATAFRSHIQAA